MTRLAQRFADLFGPFKRSRTPPTNALPAEEREARRPVTDQHSHADGSRECRPVKPEAIRLLEAVRRGKGL